MTDDEAMELYCGGYMPLELPSGGTADIKETQIEITSRHGLKTHISKKDLRFLFFYLRGHSLVTIKQLQELYGDS